jgi:hypothetical protein
MHQHVARLLLGHSQSLSLLAHGAVALKGIKVGRMATCMACSCFFLLDGQLGHTCWTLGLTFHGKVMAAGNHLTFVGRQGARHITRNISAA